MRKNQACEGIVEAELAGERVPGVLADQRKRLEDLQAARGDYVSPLEL